VDLNLIRPMCALLEERHVSRAAERCGMSQPAMSRILERLRAVFDDKLLVRNARAYERTPLGELLLADLQDILSRVDAALSGRRFRPEQCDTQFRLATTDYASVVFLPDLLRDLESRAPNAALTITAWNDRSYDDLGSGRLDVAIMSADDPPGTLQCERLFTEDYVCMVAADHPARGRRLRLETYLSYRHAVIDIMNGSQPSIDQPLSGRGVRRRIGYLTPFLGSAAFAVARTSMILTVPRRLADRYRDFVPVRILMPPREISQFAYSLLWHKRLETSSAHAWLRERIRELAKEGFSKSRISA
jgi:DNA-binding transcriptional LysR family regulator